MYKSFSIDVRTVLMVTRKSKGIISTVDRFLTCMRLFRGCGWLRLRCCVAVCVTVSVSCSDKELRLQLRRPSCTRRQTLTPCYIGTTTDTYLHMLPPIGRCVARDHTHTRLMVMLLRWCFRPSHFLSSAASSLPTALHSYVKGEPEQV